MRTKVAETSGEIKSWDEADNALADIGRRQRDIEQIQGDMQAKIDSAKGMATVLARPHQDRIANLERQLKTWAEAHRDDMEGKKTMTLAFGSVGFRKSTRITLPRPWDKLEQVIRALRARGMGDCVKETAPKVDKDALRKYSADEILTVGAEVKVEDVFWYEPDREKIPAVRP